MKANGRIGALLRTSVRNEQDYLIQVLHPLLDELGFPKGGNPRWPEFPTRNPTGEGWLKIDLLTAVGDVPLLVTETKERAAQFEVGLRQASVHGRNFEPREDAGIRRMTVPFLFVAAGHRAEMFRATVRGIDVVYERLDGLLEWEDLLREAARFAAPKAAAREDLAVAPLARQFLEAVHEAIWSVPRLRRQDDRRVIILAQVIRLARENLDHRIGPLCARNGMPSAAARQLRLAIERYRSALDAHVFHGDAVARAFHDFVTSPGLNLFGGKSQYRQDLSRGHVRYRKTARYFTPRDVARQMVRLARIAPSDRVIDPTCGSGTFLVEAIAHVGAGDPGSEPRFADTNLVGIDDDPFCIETARTLLSLLFHDAEVAPDLFVHNCLYTDGPDPSETEDVAEAEPLLQAGSYDVVVGNPPGNDSYSGTNARFVESLWERRYGHLSNKEDPTFFVRRFVDLARPEGGRIVVLVPDGFLAAEKFESLREEVLAGCEPRAVVTLPRLFRNNEARMSIVSLVRTASPDRSRRVFLASVPDDQDVNVVAELEALTDRALEQDR